MTGDQQTPIEYTGYHWRNEKTNTVSGEPGDKQRLVEKNTDYMDRQRSAETTGDH